MKPISKSKNKGLAKLAKKKPELAKNLVANLVLQDLKDITQPKHLEKWLKKEKDKLWQTQAE